MRVRRHGRARPRVRTGPNMNARRRRTPAGPAGACAPAHFLCHEGGVTVDSGHLASRGAPPSQHVCSVLVAPVASPDLGGWSGRARLLVLACAATFGVWAVDTTRDATLLKVSSAAALGRTHARGCRRPRVPARPRNAHLFGRSVEALSSALCGPAGGGPCGWGGRGRGLVSYRGHTGGPQL